MWAGVEISVLIMDPFELWSSYTSKDATVQYATHLLNNDVYTISHIWPCTCDA